MLTGSSDTQRCGAVECIGLGLREQGKAIWERPEQIRFCLQ